MKERRASFRRDATSGFGAKKPPDASRTNRRLSRLCGILIARARRTGDRPERRVIEANEWCSTVKTLVRARSFDEGATDGFGKRTRAPDWYGTLFFWIVATKKTNLTRRRRTASLGTTRVASRPPRGPLVSVARFGLSSLAVASDALAHRFFGFGGFRLLFFLGGPPAMVRFF